MDENPQTQNTRKRAVIACEYCRKRKRRCDGKQPICSLCQQADREECQYVGLGIPTQATGESESSFNNREVVDALTGRIRRLDAIIEAHTSAINRMSDQLSYLVNDAQEHQSPRQLRAPMSENTPVTTESSTPFTYGGLSCPPNELLPMDIPVGHGTTTEDLLRTDQIKALLGSYPIDIFLITERLRNPPGISPSHNASSEPLPQLDEISMNRMVESYFTNVNPKNPIMDERKFRDLIEHTDIVIERLDARGCLIMLVLALGKASNSSPEAIRAGSQPGHEYFQPAIEVLLRQWPLSFQTDLYMCQALFLAATWYSLLCWPMQAWRMIHMASTALQHEFLTASRDNANSRDLIRLSWALSLGECDLLAEYHLPRSGIENIIERLFYPECDTSSEDVDLIWLSNLSARRLMNRVHFTIYNSPDDKTDYTKACVDRIVQKAFLNPTNTRAFFATATELYNQLHQWWGLLPSSIKPDQESPESEPSKIPLALRFHACGDIIYRPFLYKVCSTPTESNSELDMLEPALICIHHCRKFLQIVGLSSTTASPFTIINLHSTLAVILNLVVASQCPLLQPHLTDINELEVLASSILERWATKGSSGELMWKISIMTSDKRKLLLRCY